MKKKKLVITIAVIIGILAIVGIYFGYKSFLLSFHQFPDDSKQEYQNLLSGYEKRDTLEVKHSEALSEGMLTYKNVQFQNVVEGFEKTEEDDYVSYKLLDSNGNYQAYFTVSITEPFLDRVGKDDGTFVMGKDEIDAVESDDFAKRKGLKNDVDFFDYLIEHQNDKHDLFTSVKTIKEDHYVQLLSYIMLPSVDSVTVLKGDLEGYILNNGDMKEVNILEGGKRYVFSFIRLDYFTDDVIREFINTLVIDKSIQ